MAGKRREEIKELLEERLDTAAEDEPLDAFYLRVGQVQWNEDPEDENGGFWLASFGAFDHKLEGLTRDDRERAREQAKDYVAEMIEGRISDWIYSSEIPRG